MDDLISRSALLCEIRRYAHLYLTADQKTALVFAVGQIETAPAVDAAPVVRCKDCIYFHEAHVLCNDGTEKPFSAFPKEAFGVFGDCCVKSDYGINIGAQCEIEKHSGYSEDKSVFRNPEDFCSRGARMDAEAAP